MKKMITIILSLICVIGLVGCNSTESNTQEEQVAVYSFSGRNEQFIISNGVIVFSETEEIFYGGDLEVIQEELFMDIDSYSITFYTMTDGEKSPILSRSVVDMTDSSVKIDGELGKISGDSILMHSKIENADDLRNNLWFELNTTDAGGKENTYQLQLALTVITDNREIK